MSSHRRRDATLTIRVHRWNVVSLLLSSPRTPPRRGKHPARRADGAAGKGGGRKRRPAWNGPDRGCNITSRESGQTSLWSGVTREPGQQTSRGDAEMSQAAMLAGAAPNRGDAACLPQAGIVKVSSGERRPSASVRGDGPVVQFAGLGVSNSPTADREATAHQRRTGSDCLPREGDRLPSAAAA